MSDELCNLFASKFIQRKDVKAIQTSEGHYQPHTNNGKRDGLRIPWTRTDLQAHIAGTASFGHYLLDHDNLVKLFAFDIDLEAEGKLPLDPAAAAEEILAPAPEWLHSCNPREEWHNRASVARPYMKLQFKEIATRLASSIYTDLGIPCAVTYTGNKGLHVYGFTGSIPAHEAREAAHIVMDSVGGFQPKRGNNFFAAELYPNFSIEIFPKQDSLDGKDLGNLMRLPLGKNFKNPTDPTFFIDMTSPLGQMIPLDPVYALTAENQFAGR